MFLGLSWDNMPSGMQDVHEATNVPLENMCLDLGHSQRRITNTMNNHDPRYSLFTRELSAVYLVVSEKSLADLQARLQIPIGQPNSLEVGSKIHVRPGGGGVKVSLSFWHFCPIFSYMCVW